MMRSLLPLVLAVVPPHKFLVLTDDIPHEYHRVDALALLRHLTKLTLTWDVLDACCLIPLVALSAAPAAADY